MTLGSRSAYGLSNSPSICAQPRKALPRRRGITTGPGVGAPCQWEPLTWRPPRNDRLDRRPLERGAALDTPRPQQTSEDPHLHGGGNSDLLGFSLKLFLKQLL